MQTKPIAETKKFIILEQYKSIAQPRERFQSECELEQEFIEDLEAQGYEFVKHIKTPVAMLANVREQLQRLNHIEFTDKEWIRFVNEYLDHPQDGLIQKTKKIHENDTCDFKFDNGQIQNIYLFDKKILCRNKMQVINQFTQEGKLLNRYDVTILINGLPLVQVELKKRGSAIQNAFGQIDRYKTESFNSDNSLYKYLQIFVISNGTDSRYFSNTTKRDKNSFDFTMNWANLKNEVIGDLKDFTATFFQKKTLLNLLFTYSVFDSTNTLLIMRPYQIAAAERILWKIQSSYAGKQWSTKEGGGYIWHTTGSGKTLTSFKAARLATEIPFIDKVFFVVDRKDLDYQTIREYQKFSPDSVNGSNDTAGLKKNLEKDDNKIIVTTIQKLNNLMRQQESLPIYQKQVVFIFDECHRSQFGEAQKNLNKKFKRFYQFGFTGTPIFEANAIGEKTTGDIFGTQLHSYIITDAIRDGKVLKFMVDYHDTRPKFKEAEGEIDEKKLSHSERIKLLLHQDRISSISKYILDHFNEKTHRLQNADMGFNAMFAVGSVQAAKLYYETFKNLQKESESPLNIATIFSFAPNEERPITTSDDEDESFDNINAMDSTAKEFLSVAIHDYNTLFATNFSIEGNSFQNYYRDLAKRTQSREIDLLIVVGMFLTGFDAPRLNTLFVDKNLRYHGLIQAYSRTNRILNSTKGFGNIVTFRDLDQALSDAIRLFGDKDSGRDIKNIILERSYHDKMYGHQEPETGIYRRGFIEIVENLEKDFPDIHAIEKESDKKAFVRQFGEFLRAENELQNYDDFTTLKALQKIDVNDVAMVEEFKATHNLTDEKLQDFKNIKLPSEYQIQNYKSMYNDISDWIRREKNNKEQTQLTLDWDDVAFDIELIKSQEINLDFILKQLFEKYEKNPDKEFLKQDIRNTIRASFGHRAKENLIMSFVDYADLDHLKDNGKIQDAFYHYAKEEHGREVKELIDCYQLPREAASYYIKKSLNTGFVSEYGDELGHMIDASQYKKGRRDPEYHKQKKTLLEKMKDIVDKFKGIF